jgi:hypothetical protein
MEQPPWLGCGYTLAGEGLTLLPLEKGNSPINFGLTRDHLGTTMEESLTPIGFTSGSLVIVSR